MHVLVGGKLDKTIASALSTDDLHELQLRGATAAGPPPATAAPRNRHLHANTVIDVDRTVDASGVIGLGGHDLPSAHRVTARLDGHLIHVSADGALAKALPHPSPTQQRNQVCGARVATTAIKPAPAGPIRVERRVPTDGIVMVTRQRVRVGRSRAGKLVTVLVEDTHLRVLHNGEEFSLHPRSDNRPVTRFRANHTDRASR